MRTYHIASFYYCIISIKFKANKQFRVHILPVIFFNILFDNSGTCCRAVVLCVRVPLCSRRAFGSVYIAPFLCFVSLVLRASVV